MKTHIALALAGSLSLASLLGAGSAQAQQVPQLAQPAPSYETTVQSVANMVQDSHAWQLVQEKGLNILNVLWEDTGRYLGSSVGPNISDVTIEVHVDDAASGQPQNYLMPVIRYPNFTDRTGDIDIDKFFVRVGNHRKGGALETVSLRELLAHPTRYMSLPRNGKIQGGSLLARRDSHVLVSAQHAFLPIPQQGKATFYPVIFNYQSYEKNPAVLTILVTRQGTSMTIVDNNRDTVGGAGSWGQRLYFNAAGERTPLTAERLKDVMDKGTTMNGESAASLGEDANLLMLIQVPLEIKAPPVMDMAYGDGMAAPSAAPMAEGAGMERRSGGGGVDIDRAVLGHGPSEGPYTELDGLTIKRDPRFPVRVTVQFYQATSNGAIDAENIAAMAAQIERVYASADYVGSLVVPEKAQARPTQWSGTSHAPEGLSWMSFPGLTERYQKYGQHGVQRFWYSIGGW
jgi:hypothetical protein